MRAVASVGALTGAGIAYKQLPTACSASAEPTSESGGIGTDSTKQYLVLTFGAGGYG